MQAPLGFRPGHLAAYGDLGPVTGLAGQRRDLDRPVGDLGHLQREQAADQVGVGAGHGDLRAALAAGDRDHAALEPHAVRVDLARDLLSGRQDGLDGVLGRAQLDHDVAVGGCAWPLTGLLHEAGHDVALAPGVLAVGLGALRLAQALQDDLLGGARRDAAEALGGVVPLAQDGAGLVDLRREDRDLPGGAVERDPGVRLVVLGVLVGGQQRRLDRLHDQVEGDVLLPLQAAEHVHVDLHDASSSGSVSLRLNSICTRPRARSA